MWGANAWAAVPYASLGGVINIAACISTRDDMAFTVSVGDQLATTVETSVHSC